MGEFNHNFMDKPPWSGQSVRPLVRFLAWIFLFCALLAGVAGVYLITQESGVEAEHLPAILLFVIGELYFGAILLHVGIKGVAPASWLPWK